MYTYCSICHKCHDSDEECPPMYENPLKPFLSDNLEPSSRYSPVNDFNLFNKPEREPAPFPLIDPSFLNKPKFDNDFLSNMNPNLFDTPKFEPEIYPKIEPLIPPPSPVIDFNNSTIGWKPEFDNHIYTGIGGNGPRLSIDPGGLVRDQMDHLIGQMGPMNTILPPDLPQMPDYGGPQSDPGAWDPGYSPMGPVY